MVLLPKEICSIGIVWFFFKGVFVQGFFKFFFEFFFFAHLILVFIFFSFSRRFASARCTSFTWSLRRPKDAWFAYQLCTLYFLIIECSTLIVKASRSAVMDILREGPTRQLYSWNHFFFERLFFLFKICFLVFFLWHWKIFSRVFRSKSEKKLFYC